MENNSFATLVNILYPTSPWRSSYIEREERWEEKQNPWHAFGQFQNMSAVADGGEAHATAFVDSRLMAQPERCGLIGRIEASNPMAFQQVLGYAEQWLRERGCTKVIGPVNWSVWHHHRFLTEGSGPTTLEPHNLSWYPAEIVRAGYAPLQEYMTAARSDIAGLLQLIAPLGEEMRREKVEIVRLDPGDLMHELPSLYAVSSESFDDSPAYLQITFDEFAYLYQPLVHSPEKTLLYVARDNGRIVGYLFALRDPERPTVLLMKTVAVAPAYQRKHIAIALAALAHQEALANGCTSVEYVLVRVGNNVAAMPYPGVRPMRKFQNFVKSL